MRSILALALAALALATLRPRPAECVHAGTAVRYDIEGLVGEADLVLEARVVAQRAVREAGGRIETESTLSVARTFLGQPLATRTIRLPGGVLPDGRGMMIPGLPALAPGEDVVLFLSAPNATGMRMPVGLAQGLLRIVADRTGAKRLVRDQRDLALVDAPGQRPEEAASSASFDYTRTLAEIERAVAAKRARRAAGQGSRWVGR